LNIIYYRVHSPTNALFIKLENALKFTLKFKAFSDLIKSAFIGE
jgi:hypothetical protein